MDTEAGIEHVIARYKNTVYGIALTHTPSKSDADDVFQEVFVAYWQGKPQLNSEEHRKAWLIRTTLNLCLKVTQSSWAKKAVLTDEVPERSVDLSVDVPFETEQQEALYEAMRALSLPYRTAVQLFYFEDLPIARIAEILDEEQGAIKTRLSRARAELRKKLKAGNKHD